MNVSLRMPWTVEVEQRVMIYATTVKLEMPLTQPVHTCSLAQTIATDGAAHASKPGQPSTLNILSDTWYRLVFLYPAYSNNPATMRFQTIYLAYNTVGFPGPHKLRATESLHSPTPSSSFWGCQAYDKSPKSAIQCLHARSKTKIEENVSVSHPNANGYYLSLCAQRHQASCVTVVYVDVPINTRYIKFH